MKLPVALSVTRAAGVSLEWLATGEGPTQAGPEPSSSPAPSPPRSLFSQINADLLGEAYATAIKALRSHGHVNPEPRRIMQVTVLIYDELASDAENSPRNTPQDLSSTDAKPS